MTPAYFSRMRYSPQPPSRRMRSRDRLLAGVALAVMLLVLLWSFR
jgi:hypothetical protein